MSPHLLFVKSETLTIAKHGNNHEGGPGTQLRALALVRPGLEPIFLLGDHFKSRGSNLWLLTEVRGLLSSPELPSKSRRLS